MFELIIKDKRLLINSRRELVLNNEATIKLRHWWSGKKPPRRRIALTDGTMMLMMSNSNSCLFTQT
jgi:hypothetical protein